MTTDRFSQQRRAVSVVPTEARAAQSPQSDAGGLAERIAALSPRQRELLKQRFEQRSRIAGRPKIVRRDGPRELFPASFGQERLWFLHHLNPSSPAYLLFFAFRFRGALEIAIFAGCLDALVRRHEVLRTQLEAKDGDRPSQRITPLRRLDLPVLDLTTLRSADQEAEFRRLAAGENRRPFDLGRSPLLRTHLVRLAADHHLFLLTMHHAIADGWSMNVLMQEVSILYGVASADRLTPLQELPIQYGDYALWQRSWWESEASKQQLAYWKEQLHGLAPVLDLPTDRPRPKLGSGRGRRKAVQLPEPVTHGLKDLARRRGTTLFAVLLAAYQVFLHRLAGRTDIAVGAPFAGRTAPELEGLIGFFVNTLVLRTELGGDPSFETLVDVVNAVVARARAHQELPFEKLVEDLQPERSLSRTPLVQTFFTLQGSNRDEIRMPGLTVSPLSVEAGRAQFDLGLFLSEEADRLVGYAEYSDELFDDSTCGRFMAYFQTLCRGIAADAGRPLSALPLVSDSERAQLLREWNDAEVAYPPAELLHQGIEDRVRQAPDAIAVVFEGRALSYRALNQRANQLAHYLRSQGVGSEGLVGIYMERSAEMVIALLATLKAGGAYVPIDPGWPRQRITFILEDTGARILLTTAGWVEDLPDTARLIRLDADASLFRRQEVKDPVSLGETRQLAYTIYTSGSTGKPKGAMNSHAGVLNRLLWMQDAYGLGPEDRVLQKTSFSFDVSVWEFFWTLMQGARLVVARPGGHRDTSYLADRIAEERVTVLHFVPSMLRSFLREPKAVGCSSLRLVITSGEELTIDLVLDARRLWRAQLHNLYGVTEAAIDSTFWDCERGLERGRVPLGRPLANNQIYVLDSALRLLPLGVPGEICLGGCGLARGYLRRPALTATAFVPHPFLTGERIYRTGDLGRWLPDGRLEFLGRIDFQVKIRGFRIELGEIEAMLGEHPAVAETVVAAPARAEGDRQLVAYYVAAKGSRPTADELRAFLRHKLPDYMIPMAFVAMEAIPLSPSGKADRKMLPTPEQGAFTSQAPYEAPSNPTEELMAEIWAEVLDLESVGVRHNFFSIGGQSLLALRVLSRVRQSFGVDLPVETLFEAPTVADLCEVVARAQGKLSLPPLEPADRDAPLPLSYAQQRLWFLDQLLPANAAYNLPVGLRITGPIDVATLARAVTEVLRRHEVLRTRFVTREGRPFQEILPLRPVRLPLLDLMALDRGAREHRARIHSDALVAQPFALAREPSFRAVLMRLDSEDHLLLVVAHHIVFDGSVAIFLRELTQIYESFIRGQPCPLPEPPIQYADFAQWQRGWLNRDAIEMRLAFWRELLGRDLEPLQLPTDRPRSALQSLRGGIREFPLSDGSDASLRALARQEGATPFMVVLAAFAVLLHRYSGRRAIRIGTPVMDRPAPELESLIGCFVNTLVLPFQLSAGLPFRELLAQVRQRTLGAYQHKDLPFEVLVDALQPQRDLSQPPLFQVMLTFRDAGGIRLRAPAGLELDLPLIDGGTARFDLLLVVAADNGWSGRIEYNADLFDVTTVDRMTRHFGRLLTGAVAEPDSCLAALPLLSAAEGHQVVREWNDTCGPTGDGPAIHRLFEAQVARSPQAPAVLAGRKTLSRDAVNREANRLAHKLIALGVVPGSLVGVYLGRSERMISTVLAILKAGGAYVPLVSEFPPERIRWILESLGVRHLITQPDLLAGAATALASVPQLEHILCPWVSPEVGEAMLPPDFRDRVGWKRQLEGCPEVDPVVTVTPEDLAYVIFTSGSTGIPKGVVVRHEAVLNLIDWVNRTFDVSSRDRVLFVNSLSFDLSVYDIFGVLAAGGSLRVAGAHELREPSRLSELLADPEITFWDSAPAAFQQLLPFLPDGTIPGAGLRLVLLSGDWIPVGMPDRIRSHFPGARVISLGGATEATVWSNWFPINEVAESWSSIPYGWPMRNARYQVLDEAFEPTPQGVAGDLYIGGICLASVYAGRPALTAERFLPDPNASSAGGRLYRTGDRARYWKDGTLEFLGRLDHQVKIRGYRIELGEIEAVLMDHPRVREAVVLAVGQDRHDRRLVAYVVAMAMVSTEQLRQLLKEKLPEYMVPSTFVQLDSIPLTPNGKVDRRALPVPEPGRTSTNGKAGTFQTPIQELIAGIWAEVLGIEPTSPGDDFFELGGHSLLATQVLARLRQMFELDLPLQSLFEFPKLVDLARSVDKAVAQRDALEAPPLVRQPRGGPMVVSFSQQRLWLEDRLHSAGAAFNIPANFQLRGRFEVAAFEEALNLLHQRHESLRTSFVELDGQPMQRIEPPMQVRVPEVDLSGLSEPMRGNELRRQARRIAGASFDLTRAPLFRVALLRLEPELNMVTLSMHHIVSDGWSMGILIRELAILYAALIEKRPPEVPDMPIQYPDFAAWQRQWLRGETLDFHLGYWRRQLADLPPPLELPADRKRDPNRRPSPGVLEVQIREPIPEKLRELSQAEGVTLFMTLLAAFQTMQSHFSGQEDLCTGVSVAGRRYLDLESIIGFFINTLVLRLNLGGDPTFRELLGRVRQTTLEAYAHQDLPYEKLVEALPRARSGGRPILYRTTFQMQNFPVTSMALPGLTLSRITYSGRSVRSDLDLEMSETGKNLYARFRYDQNLFDHATIHRMMHHLEQILTAVTQDPEASLSRLATVGAEEDALLNADFNDDLEWD